MRNVKATFLHDRNGPLEQRLVRLLGDFRAAAGLLQLHSWYVLINSGLVVDDARNEVGRRLAAAWVSYIVTNDRIRAAKYTVDGGARGMREVFRSASWPPRLWA